MEPNQLGHETHIRIGDLPSGSDVIESLFNRDFLSEDHIAEAHGRGSGNTLHTVNVNSTSFLLGLLHELYDFIETALDVLSHVVFQVQR